MARPYLHGIRTKIKQTCDKYPLAQTILFVPNVELAWQCFGEYEFNTFLFKAQSGWALHRDSQFVK